MGNISTDQKLQLVQRIRAESQDNRVKMRSREKLLYGTDNRYETSAAEELPLYTKGCYGADERKDVSIGALEEAHTPHRNFSSFRLRTVLSVLIFTGFLLLDAGNASIAGVTASELQKEVNRNFDESLTEVVFDFENNFPYTLFINNKNAKP